MTRLYVVTNPQSGHLSSFSILHDTVEPLLAPYDLDIVRYTTQCKGDGERIGRLIRSDAFSSSPSSATREVNVALLGGDGTTHEVLNGFFAVELQRDTEGDSDRNGDNLSLNFIPIPTGTANALYAACFPPSALQRREAQNETGEEWRMKSLRSFLFSLSSPSSTQDAQVEVKTKLAPLSLLLNQYVPSSSSSDQRSQQTLTHLVTSHALHAGILHDSETATMRARHPGIERFKKAYELNSTRWVCGSLHLLPLVTTGRVSQYDPSSKSFAPLNVEATTKLEGPFVYLTALITDRLEPHFLPAPFSSTFSKAFTIHHNVTKERAEELQRPAEAVDLVVIRPTRDPKVRAELQRAAKEGLQLDESVRTDFVARLAQLSMAMYDGGRHVDALYEEDGATPILEYFRTGGYAFVPAADDERAKLTCLDGTTLFAQRTEASVWGSVPGRRGRAFVWT